MTLYYCKHLRGLETGDTRYDSSTSSHPLSLFSDPIVMQAENYSDVFVHLPERKHIKILMIYSSLISGCIPRSLSGKIELSLIQTII